MPRSLVSMLGAGLTAALALSLLAVSPAHARSARAIDARGDVQVATIDESNFDEDTYESRPSSTARGDILATRVTHGKHRIRVTMRYAELKRANSLYQLLIRGSNGQRRIVLVDTTSRLRGESAMARVSNGSEVCPHAISHRIDYRAKTVSVGFPRRCIERPKSIRVAGTAVWVKLDPDSFRLFLDDPFRKGGTIDEMGTTFSQTVRRAR